MLSVITLIMLITVTCKLIQTNNLPFLDTNHILFFFKDLKQHSVIENMMSLCC